MISMIRTLTALSLAAVLLAVSPATLGEAGSVSYATLLADMAEAALNETGAAQIDADAAALADETAQSIADHWKKVWLDPDYKLYLYETDSPAQLPVKGKHAFVVLGYELQNGEMTGELMGRCNAASRAAWTFPDSIIVCSGGATGENNPEKHTEAGLMKKYLTEVSGIDPWRILTDERAMTTEENAVNTLAILQEQGVETITIITSDYHQRRGQTLYNALASLYRQEHGYSPEIVGNFCYNTGSEKGKREQEMMIAIYQLASILELPEDQMELLNEKMPMRRPK